MRRLYLVTLFLIAGLVPAQAEQAQFFESIQDMPLMPGLYELPDQTVMFDKPEGRIIESVAEIETGSKQEIQNYYETTLPQLGWSQIKEGAFIRQNEHLKLAFENYEGQNFLRVIIQPK